MIDGTTDTLCASFEPDATIDEVASLFTSADDALLRTRALLRRTDTKFVIPAGQVSTLLRELTQGYALLGTEGTFRPDYRTLYYDSPELDMFHAHRRGQRPRYKIRVRHHVARHRSFLEQKCKGPNGRTVKRRLDRDFGDNSVDNADGLLGLFSPDRGGILVPTAWTNFQRITLVGVQSVERVTIDLGLTLHAGNGTLALPEVAIVEIKQPRVDRNTYVMRALRLFGFRPFSVSKYCTAVCLLRPDVRQTGFKEKMRELRRVAA